MKKQIIPLLIGLIVSYCFSSMILNSRIVNPIIAYHNKSVVLDMDELFANINGFDIISDNRLHSTSKDPWIEIGNIRKRIGKLRSVTYRVNVYSEEKDIKTILYYANADQDFSIVRYLSAIFKDNFVIIEIPDYAESIDKLRLQFIIMEDTAVEIEEISLNMQTRFSLLLMAFVYLLWCIVVLQATTRENQLCR